MRLLLEIIGLQTPRGRVLFFGAASAVIFLAPYHWLQHLSLWQRLGIPSPSIGLTRAYWNVLHADVPAAWQTNALIFMVLAIGLPLLGRDLYAMWSQHRLCIKK